MHLCAIGAVLQFAQRTVSGVRVAPPLPIVGFCTPNYDFLRFRTLIAAELIDVAIGCKEGSLCNAHPSRPAMRDKFHGFLQIGAGRGDGTGLSFLY
jgi:hypothetical protein